jgi:hypothetical protein
MSSDWELIGREGFVFFGKMTASISHEIKNVLAIINEKVKTQAGRIKNQIRRADGIVKNMNKFAHSVDESLMSVDLAELSELMAALSGRFAYMRGVKLEPAGDDHDKPISARKSRLVLPGFRHGHGRQRENRRSYS